MEIEELGRNSLTGVELETLGWTPCKQEKLTEFPELCISFLMDKIVLPCHAFKIWLVLNVTGFVCLRLLS